MSLAAIRVSTGHYFGVYDKDEKTASDRLESIKAEMSAFVENKLG